MSKNTDFEENRKLLEEMSENFLFANNTFTKFKELSKEERLLISLQEILSQSENPKRLISALTRHNYLLESDGKQ